MGNVRRWGLLLTAVGSLLVAQLARAGEKERKVPLLLGGAVSVQKSPAPLDPVLPRGGLRGALDSQVASPRAALFAEHLGAGRAPLYCSSRRPVCVQGATARPDLVLTLLETAWERHTFGLSLAAPRSSFAEPLVWKFDPQATLRLQIQRLPSRGFDRASARCLGGRPTTENARRCVTEAGLVGQAPATAAWLREGMAAEVARRAGPAPEASAALGESLRRPYVGIATSSSSYQSWRHIASHHKIRLSTARSVRLFSYLEARSEQASGEASWLALSLAATHTKAGASRWQAEPDLFDVLASTLGGEREELARFVDDFAAHSFERAAAWGQSMYRAWRFSSDSLPRTVVIAEPLEPTGSGYVQVDLSPSDQKKEMAFRVRCEDPVSYVWSVLRFNQAGRRLAGVAVPYRERDSGADVRVQPLAGTASLVFVTSNVGGIDLAHPFDPDHAPHEAHGCRLSIDRLQ